MYDYFEKKERESAHINIHEAYIPVNITSQLCEFHSPYHVILVQSDYSRLVFEAPHVISATAEKIKFYLIIFQSYYKNKS